MTPTRRLAAIMAADVAGFSAAMERDEEGTFAQVQELRQKIIEPKIAEHQGRLIKTTGDGIVATFDGPGRAVRAACRLREVVAELGITIRAGAHTGELELMGENVGGVAVHAGARVMALAQPGEVLVTRTVVDLVSGAGITFEPRGSHSLRGLPGEWPLFAAKVC